MHKGHLLLHHGREKRNIMFCGGGVWFSSQYIYLFKCSKNSGMEVEESNPYFPLKEFIVFNTPLKSDALTSKLKEFNGQVARP